MDERKGEFPGMLKKRTFNIVLVGENKGVGVEVESAINKTVIYSGTKNIVKF